MGYYHLCSSLFKEEEEREKEGGESGEKGYTRGYLLPSSSQGTLVDGEREREREAGSGSPPPVIVSALILDQFTGYIRVYAPTLLLCSRLKRANFVAPTRTTERERVFIETRAVAMGSSTSRNVEPRIQRIRILCKYCKIFEF